MSSERPDDDASPEQEEHGVSPPPLPSAARVDRRRLGAVIGALLAIAAVAYHNSHVSIWTGGTVVRPIGYLVAAAVGAGIGYFLVGWVQHGK